MMRSQPHFCFHLLLAMSVVNEITSRIEFTNFVCTSTDEDFCGVDYCILKAVNRSYKYVSAKVIIYQKPITNMLVNFALFKRANGYKPFLYNISIDACKFLKNQKASPVTQYFYGFIKDVTNVNHSCPYNEDITMEKLSLEMINHRLTALLPFPEGEYMFQSYWTTNNKMVGFFKLFVTLSYP